ncbi:glycosyltransferase family A protein [Anaerococcus sp. Marseille-P3625]|uniref:glycosyltransferase family A protein n=1 Tax=Anaerococcus sp. Marseille-P3625 TaxID=1977277 RepID=UPI000C073003|nr:glycosyltransferase family A protein [Anaerococcus sp. Marseille-P3625]
MKIEVLISTMNEKSIACYKRFNLETDALIINQTDHNSYEEINVNDKKIRMISTDTRGLGLSRNLAILNSKADILVFADDDEVFEEGYNNKILSEFKAYPDVDFFIFKTIIYQNDEKIIKVKEDSNLKFYKSLKYGSVHFAFKKEAIRRNNISISTYFGAGTDNGSGEDSLFIRDCFKKGLRLRTSTKLIAKIYNDNSTWFTGYNDKFFFDKGKLSKALFPRAYRLYIEYFLRNHREKINDIKIARKLMINGAKEFGGENEK